MYVWVYSNDNSDSYINFSNHFYKVYNKPYDEYN